MKKTLIVLVLLFAAVSAFALSAKVLDVVGKVEYQRADGSWAAVSAGTTLGPGTVLSTGFKSEAVISVDESTITVKALTRLTIEKLYEQDGNKSSSFYLDAGGVGADVKSAADKKVSFTVKTPAVTASVRGTAGDLTVNRLVGTSGTWILLPPQPKAISFNRGDATRIEEESNAVEETGGIVEPTVGAAALEGGAEGEGASDESDDFDWSTDSGVTVKPGQQASFSVGAAIVTPMETAAAAATSTGGTQSLSAKESVASGSGASSAASAATSVLSAVQSSLSSDINKAAAGVTDTPTTPNDPTPPPVDPPVDPKPTPKNGSLSIGLKWPTLTGGNGKGTGTINIEIDWGN